MSVLIDSGVWIAFYNKRDERHEKATEIMREVNAGAYGDLLATDYILDEVVTHCMVRYSVNTSLLVGEAILGTTEVIQITQDIVAKAWELFKTDKHHPSNGKFLSFTDCTSIVVAQMHAIGHVATFDSRFKKYVRILDL